MKPKKNIYLITLEVSPIAIGRFYDQLPAHLTLIPRFTTKVETEDILNKVSLVSAKTKNITIVVTKKEILGPKQTKVWLVNANKYLAELHKDLKTKIDEIEANFLYPEFMKNNWIPHISVRENINFEENQQLESNKIYLIEISKEDNVTKKMAIGSFVLND